MRKNASLSNLFTIINTESVKPKTLTKLYFCFKLFNDEFHNLKLKIFRLRTGHEGPEGE
jgi:hypothetical protein